MTKRIKNWKATAAVPGNDTRNKRRATTMDARRVAPLPVWQFAGATETIGMSNSIFSNNIPWRYKVPEIYYDFEVEIELTKLRQDEALELTLECPNLGWFDLGGEYKQLKAGRQPEFEFRLIFRLDLNAHRTIRQRLD